MEEPMSNDFESREYQIELYELALEKNLILYLPTGSGKTYIATLLIKEYGKAREIFKPIEEGGKRLFFLVNTVALVDQQAQQIRSQSTFKIGEYSGDKGVDLWKRSTWIEEIDKHQVLVMTCQIFLDLIQSNTIGIKNVSLLIFDECHRGVSNHPMRQVMKNFKDIPAHQQPRVLGLTATLLNGNIKGDKVKEEIKTLENTFMAQIATSVNEEMVKLYSTNPRESKITYSESMNTNNQFILRDRVLDQLKMTVDAIQVEEVVKPPVESVPYNSRQIDNNYNKRNKRLKNLIEDIKVNMDELGLYGGSMAVLAHLVQVEQMLPNVQLETARLLYQSVVADCVLLRRTFECEMMSHGWSEKEVIHNYSSDKIVKLFNILSKVKPEDRAIVFVKRRFTAKILYYILKRASAVDPKLKNVKSNFIVGYNIGNPFKDTRENYLQRSQNKKVMALFNHGVLNVLFASNVVEEGIDITQCNYVIMFDPVQDFRGYIQSKGRARDKDSVYIMMVCNTDSKFASKYDSFCRVEWCLKEILYGGKFKSRSLPTDKELNDSLFVHKPGLEPYRPKGINGPTITALSAISLINRYFVTLKYDKFTKVTPFWWVKEEGGKFKCFLQLPMESKIRGCIESTLQMSVEDAKRSVALEACKKLHQIGELDDLNFLPLTNDNAITDVIFTPCEDFDEIFEEKIGEKKVKIGTKKNKRTWEKKWADCLCKCRPKPNEKAYVHVLHMKPMYLPPLDNHRLQAVHETLSLSNTFALVSSKKLPKLAPFPLYLSTGELEANVEYVYSTTFNQKQLEQIIEFHSILFDNVLSVAKKFCIRDFSNTRNAYLIAPVTLDVSKKLTIDWDVMDKTNHPFPPDDVMPSKEERMSLKIDDEHYLGKVVSPWYRSLPPHQKYLVTKVCYDMTENTNFPSDIYSTYKDYFLDKYKIEPLIKNQPLLEVRPFSQKYNSIKPRALTKDLKRKNKEENEDFEVWLLPEYCVLYPLPGKYWVKAILVPSILHRISQLCMAEELRTTIVKETGVGRLKLESGVNWNKLKIDVCQLENESVSMKQQALTPMPTFTKTYNTQKSPVKIWDESEEPIDIERNMNSITLFDVMSYGRFIEKPLLGDSYRNGVLPEQFTSVATRPVKAMVDPPCLKMLNESCTLGPQQVEVMQALIAAVANDCINCERLETLGDSFLKYAISLTLFETQLDWAEGRLTHFKGKIVGNKNLYFCGKRKKLGAILEVQDFSPKEDWVPPGFGVEKSLESVIRNVKINPSCLYNVELPEEDRKSGKLSPFTSDYLTMVVLDSEEMTQPQNNTFINQQALTDKNISDAVEAILGIYLKNCGINGALSILNWFEVTDPSLSKHDLFAHKTSSSAKGIGNPNAHLIDPEYLEKILNYKFQDRHYLLQALTHPSYSRNNITDSYQRLEFLGDALIDFLITVHIYEKCDTLSPGDLTDLRSALVNNITLACIAVRNEFHKFLLYCSSNLNDVMMRFVKHQEDKNHLIDNDILFLIEEEDVNVAEAVEVPKALGDIFEALVGAIYLDSGKNMDITWKVIYNLMSEEIEKFHKDVPKNHVRMIFESGCSPTFESAIESSGVVMVAVEFMCKGSLIRCNGYGDNKHQAKRAAAKHALRKLLK